MPYVLNPNPFDNSIMPILLTFCNFLLPILIYLFSFGSYVTNQILSGIIM
jgi:hypothetical protein